MFRDCGIELLQNGKKGEVGGALSQVSYDPGLMRPYLGEDGRPYVSMGTGQYEILANGKKREKRIEVSTAEMMTRYGKYHDVYNATLFTKDAWIELDQAVLMETRQRLRAWEDLAMRNSYSGFDGMAKTVLEYQTVTDPGSARIDMDGDSDSDNDRPRYQLEGLPLPIIHSGFTISERELAISRNSGMPLDTTQARNCARRVSEVVENLTIGTIASSGTTWGTSTDYGNTSAIYGYLNHPDINTKTDVTQPTGTNSNTTVAEVLAMRELLYADGFFGPFVLYHSTDWDQYMDNDYYVTSTGAPYLTLRQRLQNIDGIESVKRLDYLTSADNPYTLLLVQMTEDVARAVTGLPITTVQWSSRGGMRHHFKIMTIMVPQVRSTFAGNCGIVKGTTS